MKRLQVAGVSIALALLTWLYFPGHTWLQQDSQIYVPILENMRDPTVLRNDILVQQPHVAYTLYDEAAVGLSRITGLSLRTILSAEQIATRALGIWGLYLIGQALGLPVAGSLLVALIVALGARIAGPEVLTFEYEPTPRAFAAPLLFCGIGLAAHRRYLAAGIAGAVAFLYHPPTTVPFWIVFAIVLILRRNCPLPYGRGSVPVADSTEPRASASGLWPLAPLAAATAILVVAAQTQAGPSDWFGHLSASQEQLQVIRTAYVWISTWPWTRIVHYILAAAIISAAWMQARHQMSMELRVMLGGLAILGLVSMPLSWLLLERWKLSIVPQIQPLRALLFVTLAMQLLAAAAGWNAAMRGSWIPAGIWFAFAYLPALQPVMLQPYNAQRLITVLALAIGTVAARRFAPAAALAAFLAIPALGGIVNFPKLHTPELSELSAWARMLTPQDSVFLFPDIGRGLQPGVFRSEALRVVYVDWKGGGQVNYLRDFGDRWWSRWNQTMAAGFEPEQLPKYTALGIQYVVVQARNRLPRPAAFENTAYVVYRTP